MSTNTASIPATTDTGRPSGGPAVVLVLAAIVGLAPFAGDMHLASLPAIGAEFDAPVWLTQLTLTGYLLLLGIGQLAAGPVTDAVGRRVPLLIGLVLFALGSLLAALAPGMAVLVVARVLQGIGGAMGVVVANSSVRDRASGAAATRLFAALMTVTALAPVIAPAAGGILDSAFGWRSVFFVLAGLGLIVLVLAALVLKESLPAGKRQPLALGSALRGYAQLFGSRDFVLPLGGLASMFLLLFSYIGGATYVYQGQYGLDPATFGLVFGGTGIVLLVGPVLAGKLALAVPTARLARWGVQTAVLGTAVTMLAALAGLPLWTLVAGLAVTMAGLGLCEPSFMSLCMSAGGARSGQAAALIGGAQFIFGACGTALAGVVAASGAAPWALLMLAFTVIALVFTLRIPASRTA
ncbi:Bcr/CflA family efflux MFS transporter [Kocuria palustris]|uniref:Bcr/CflA family efflux MFS transporter n=1 Tax=Kocuria palustris TaxID=71999 RepID=UPI00119E5B47|nr:Bcr/CflA family efflux MFS transporter [Kocuria palustris]